MLITASVLNLKESRTLGCGRRCVQEIRGWLKAASDQQADVFIIGRRKCGRMPDA
jgi:predicted Fe-S protein YdhL (DUF1289 family)